MTDKRIKARIAGRCQAEEVFALLEWEEGTGADFADAFVDKLQELLPKRRQTQLRETHAEPFAVLANYRMPFGKHFGERMGDVDPDYLDWLCRETEEFYRVLHAYLTHNHNSTQSVLADGSESEGE